MYNDDVKPKIEVDNFKQDIKGQAAQATKDVQTALDETVKKVREQSDR